MTIVVSRFAPSPSGRLHLGHAFSALKAHDFVRERDGRFLLRIEDIDPKRTRGEFVEGIIEDLGWLGIGWDGDILVQSERLPLYAKALEKLKARGLAYPCFCTRSAIAAEIAASASAPHGTEGPVYPGTCRRLSPQMRAIRVSAEPHAWRLDVRKAIEILFPGDGRGPETAPEPGPGLSRGTLSWKDNGVEITARPDSFGDVVLARKDAPTSYHLAVTLDDAAQGITDVVRGRDLAPATHVHRLLQALLGLATPDYHHHALLLDAAGRRLAKRRGAPSLATLRATGVDPRALAASLRAGILPAGYSVSRD